MRGIVLFSLLLLGFSCFAKFEGKQSNWKGYSKTEFQVDGNTAFVVEPKKPADGKAMGLAGTVSDLSHRDRRDATQRWLSYCPY